MSLKKKIIALLLVLVLGSGLGALTFTTFRLRDTLRSEAESYTRAIAVMLSRVAGVSKTVIRDVEAILDDQMIAQAKIAAHMVAAAEKAGESKKKIRKRLKDIVNDTTLDEFWITDTKGRAYLTNIDNVDFSFSPNSKEQPQAHIFYDLLTGEAKNVAQKARVREIDNNMFKYVGTHGVDMNRIVQVGYNFSFMEDLSDRVGLRRLVDAIVKDERISTIWVFDRGLSMLAHASSASESSNIPSSPPKDSSPTDSNAPPKVSELTDLSSSEKKTIANVLKSDKIEVSFGASHIHVFAPIPSPDNRPSLGVALISFPSAALHDLLNSTIRDALWLGIFAFLIAIAIAIVVGGWLSRPILALTASVRALYGGVLTLEPIEPFTSRTDELGVFVREFKRMAVDIHQREEELDRLVKERTAALENAQKQIRDEVALASRFQGAILPSIPRHEHFTGHGFMRPAKEMGGDFYDVFVIDEKRVGLVIADVSGKGVPSAFFMAVSRTELRNEGMGGGEDPGVVLERVNAKLVEENPLDLFVTVFYAILDHTTGVLKYANGGHNPPYLMRADGTVEVIPSMGDLVLGMIDDITFKDGSMQLKPNDILFLYTDGICEAFNAKNEEFTNARMEEVLKKGDFKEASNVINRMLSAVDEHVGEAPQSDDITCLTLIYTGGEDKSAEITTSPPPTMPMA